MSSPFKRFVSALMAIVMVIAMVPSQAFAAFEDEGEDGTLTSAGSFDLDFIEGTEPEQPEDYPDDITELVNPEFSAFSGRVVDAFGQGMAAVSVQVYDRDENALLALCVTD